MGHLGGIDMFSLYLPLPPTSSPDLVFANLSAPLPSGTLLVLGTQHPAHPQPLTNHQAHRREVGGGCPWYKGKLEVVSAEVPEGKAVQGAREGRGREPTSTSAL